MIIKAENFCHGMEIFSPRNRPFTAYRMIIYILLLNSLLHYFFSIRIPDPWRSLLAPLFSPSHPTMQDYFCIFFYFYPFLEILDKVISKGNAHSENEKAVAIFYYFNVLFFVFIGALCHKFSDMIISQRGRVKKMNSRMGMYAAALGYQISFQNKLHKQIIFHLWNIDMQVDASSILLGHSVLSMFTILTGDGSSGDFGELIVWILGGLAGKALGDAYGNHYGGVWWALF